MHYPCQHCFWAAGNGVFTTKCQCPRPRFTTWYSTMGQCSFFCFFFYCTCVHFDSKIIVGSRGQTPMLFILTPSPTLFTEALLILKNSDSRLFYYSEAMFITVTDGKRLPKSQVFLLFRSNVYYCNWWEKASKVTSICLSLPASFYVKNMEEKYFHAWD